MFGHHWRKAHLRYGMFRGIIPQLFGKKVIWIIELLQWWLHCIHFIHITWTHVDPTTSRESYRYSLSYDKLAISPTNPRSNWPSSIEVYWTGFSVLPNKRSHQHSGTKKKKIPSLRLVWWAFFVCVWRWLCDEVEIRMRWECPWLAVSVHTYHPDYLV